MINHARQIGSAGHHEKFEGRELCHRNSYRLGRWYPPHRFVPLKDGGSHRRLMIEQSPRLLQ
jgi:hypothetical protein